MGSCFRPTRLDTETGKRVRYKRYRIVWTDECGQRQSEMAYTDHAASKALLERKEREAARRREGLIVTDQQHRLMPAADLIDAYVRELQSRGSEPDGPYLREQRRMLLAAFNHCGWASLGDVRRDGLRAYLASMAESGRAASTRRLHGGAVRALLRFALDQEWLPADPLAGLKLPRGGEAARTRRRRALTLAELQALLATTPSRRSSLYRLAALSGFRRRELRLMQRRDACVTGDRPRWQLRATVAKNRQLNIVPICPDAMATVRPVWDTLPTPTSRLLTSPLLPLAVPSHQTVTADLRRAGIAKVDGEGRYADFHSLRYTFCRLMAEQLPIQVVKVLMRHSSIKLTADLYGALGIEEAGERVWCLPSVLP